MYVSNGIINQIRTELKEKELKAQNNLVNVVFAQTDLQELELEIKKRITAWGDDKFAPPSDLSFLYQLLMVVNKVKLLKSL